MKHDSDYCNKRTLIFIESYGEIKQCLFITKKKLNAGNKVTIVISLNDDLYKFFTKLNNKVFNNKIELLFWDFVRNKKCSGGFGRRLLHHAKEIVREKGSLINFYKKYLLSIVNAEVYFFTRYCNLYDYYFLNKLYKKNCLTLINTVDFREHISSFYPKSIRDVLRYYKLKFIYGFNISLIQLPHGIYGYIPDGFIQRTVKREISVEEGERYLKNFSIDEFKVFNAQKFKIIYFDQPLVPRRVEEKEFKDKINKIFHIILKYFKESDLGIKHHPMWKSDRSFFTAGIEIEDFMPAEFLYNENVKVYISFSSGAIVRIEKGTVISIIDLVTFKDEREKRFIKERLIQRAYSKILFPQTMTEFENILKNV